MSLSIGIVGLPNVGKSTLFTALTKKTGLAANYPFATIDPNVGIVDVPDSRLQKLADIVNPGRIVPATVEFVDIAGLVKGANEGEGLGNQFLETAYESGYVDMLTMGATTIGLIMVGAMCANFVSLDTAIILSGSGETAQTLQSALDSIFPKLLPLIVSLLTLVGIRKGINVAWLIVIMVVVGIAGVGIGIF